MLSLRKAVALVGLIASGSPTCAAEQWPAQPYVKYWSVETWWPGDKAVVHPGQPDGFCLGGFGGRFQVDGRPSVRRGGILAAPRDALFFPTRADLDLFDGPLHALGARVRMLPRSHPVQALEDIDERSAGGRVRDELFGDGFIRWPAFADEQFPDWRELWHNNRGADCQGHNFVHYPPKPDHQLFTRPPWPKIANIHSDRKWKSMPPSPNIKMERDF